MTNLLVALGILFFTLVYIYGIEWAFRRRRPRPAWTALGAWFFTISLTDFGFVVLLLPILLFAIAVFVLFVAAFVARLIVGSERARTMWIESAFIWMSAMLLKVIRYRIVKPPQP